MEVLSLMRKHLIIIYIVCFFLLGFIYHLLDERQAAQKYMGVCKAITTFTV